MIQIRLRASRSADVRYPATRKADDERGYYPCTVTTVHMPPDESKGICENGFWLRFLELTEEMAKSAGPVLKHPGSPCDLADAKVQVPRNCPLRESPIQCPDELPSFRERFEFLWRQDVLEEHLGLALAPDGGEERVEILEVATTHRPIVPEGTAPGRATGSFSATSSAYSLPRPSRTPSACEASGN